MNPGDGYARHLTLGTTLRTDVLRVRDAGRFGVQRVADRRFATTWKAALVTAATRLLRVDVRDIDGQFLVDDLDRRLVLEALS
jgi:hypothetical protein